MMTAHHTIGAVQPARERGPRPGRGPGPGLGSALVLPVRPGHGAPHRGHVTGPYAPLRPDVVARLAGDLVLVVPADIRHRRASVVAAVRNLPDDGPVAAAAAEWAAVLGARLLVVYAVPSSFAERSVALALVVVIDAAVLVLVRARRIRRLPPT
jgi:hypothetical protein